MTSCSLTTFWLTFPCLHLLTWRIWQNLVEKLDSPPPPGTNIILWTKFNWNKLQQATSSVWLYVWTFCCKDPLKFSGTLDDCTLWYEWPAHLDWDASTAICYLDQKLHFMWFLKSVWIKSYNAKGIDLGWQSEHVCRYQPLKYATFFASYMHYSLKN